MGINNNRIKEIRESRGISAQTLANLVGSSQSVISKLENGNKKKVDPNLIDKIADYFNVSIDYLMGRTFHQISLEEAFPDGPERKNSENDSTRSNIYDEPLTEDEEDAVKAFLEMYRKMKQDKKD